MDRRLIFWGVGLLCLCYEHIVLASPGSGYALDFDGADDFVNVNYTPCLSVTDQVTLEAWVKPASYFPGGYQMIARKGNSYYLGIYGNNPYCRIYTDNWKAVRSSFNLLSNTWYHLAMTYNKDEGGSEVNLSSFDMLMRGPLLVPCGNSGNWDERIREIGNVLDEPNYPDPNKRYKLFYSGYKGPYMQNNVYIGYAYSADGNSWTKVGKVVGRSAEDPYVVVDNNGVYYLYAEDKANVTSPKGIRLYISSDCETWTDMGDVLDVQGGGNPPGWQTLDVSSPVAWIDDNDVWYLMYEGRGQDYAGRIGLAQSQDGINWVRCSDDPVMREGAPGQWDDDVVVTDDIVKIDGVYYLLYHGYALGGGFWAGMATSVDLRTWNRYKWNPITMDTDTLMFTHDGHYGMMGELDWVPVRGIYRYRPYEVSAPHLYVNGVEYSYINRDYCYNAPNHPDTKNLTIGKTPTGTPYCYNGLIDDVFLWDRALDQNEIMDSMYGDVNCPEPNLIAYWLFDEESGYIAYDFCGGINGCLGGDCYALQNSTPERVRLLGCKSVPPCTTFEDLEEMAGNWLGEVEARSGGDMDGDGVVNFCDFAILADNWFSGECSQ